MGWGDDQMKCICCDKEQEVLVSVEMKSNSIFTSRRGVCQECLKNKNINNVCIEFEIKEAKKSIESSESSIEQMKEHLGKLNDALHENGEGKG